MILLEELMICILCTSQFQRKSIPLEHTASSFDSNRLIALAFTKILQTNRFN